MIVTILKILKNYLYNTTYQIFALLIPLITTPYITRVLGSTGVGVNAYTNSIAQYFVLGGSIGIGLYGNRIIAYQRDNRDEMSQTFWSLVILRFMTLLIASVGFGLFITFTTRYHRAYIFQFVQILAAAADISWVFMGMEDFRRTVLRNFIIKLISTSCIFIFVRNSNDVLIYILILSGSTLIGNLSLWGYLRELVNPPRIEKLHFKKHLRGSLRLFVPQVSMQVYLVLNKTMLGIFVGVQSTGLYDNSDKIVKLLLTVVTAIVTVMMPRMANTFAHKNFIKLNNYLYQTLDFVTFISMLLTVGLAAVAPTFSIWFMGKDFAYTGQLIPVLSLVCPLIAWSTVLGSQYLVTTGRERQFTVSVTIGAILNVMLNLILIPTMGTMGAVFATVSAELIITLIDVYFVAQFSEVRLMFAQKWKYLVAGLLTFGVVRYLNGLLAGSFVMLISQAVIGTILYLILCILLRAPFIISASTQLHNRFNK